MTKAALPQLDIAVFEPQILWLVIVFAIFYIIVKNIIAPYFFSEIESRDNFVEDSLSEIRKLQKKAHYLHDDYNEQLKKSQHDSHHLIVTTKINVSQQIEKTRSELIANMQKQFESATVQMDNQSNLMNAQMQPYSSDLLGQIIQKISVNISVDGAKSKLNQLLAQG
jgi:F-type H+-transporting ATPase subunit b